MKIVYQLLLGALALSRFTSADDYGGDDEEYEVHGNYEATYNSSMQVQEGNHTVWFVDVGKPVSWNFYPNSIKARPGDKVMFTFYTLNHSVIQAEYGFPCIPYNMIEPGAPTFYSGFMPVEEGKPYPVWNLTINNTDPIFYYCGQRGSCNYFGMLGGINLDESTPISNQIGLARKAEFLKVPGDQDPTERQLASIQRLAASSTTAPFTVTTTPESLGTIYPTSYGGYDDHHDSESYNEDHGLSTGATAGIAVGSAVVAVAAVGLIWLLLRTRKLKKKLDEQRAAQNQPPPAMQSPMAPYGQPWPSPQAQHMSQLPPYKQEPGADMYKQPEHDGYPVSDVPSRNMSPHHSVSPYNMQGQFVGFQPGDGVQHRYTTHSELSSGTDRPMVELDAPRQDTYDQSRDYR